MTTNLLVEFLGICTLINFGMLLGWFFFLTLAHDFVYRTHAKWFKITPEQFDAIHYSGIAFYKITILFFNLVPYLGLKILL